MKRSLLGGYTTAIDIGTTKICVLIASVDIHGRSEIVGIGQYPSYGLKKGVVVNIGKTVESIKAAVQAAEQMAGVSVEKATVGISGGHIKSYNSTGVVAVKGKDVSQSDIDRVIEAAKAIPLPPDQDILHVLPQYFRVDGQEYVLDSLGMYGVRLEAQVHIITGAVASAQNIIKSCELANVAVSDIVLEQIASADAVLTRAEKEMGVGIIDIGGGTSDFAIYKDGRIRHSKVLPLAGNHFTHDVAIGLNIPAEQAEQLKKLYGSASSRFDFVNKCIDIDLGYDGGVKSVNLDVIEEILHLRAEEIFDLFLDEIQEYRLKAFMPSGLVLTGGGSLLRGMQSIASQKLGLPVRIGVPLSNFSSESNALPDLLRSPIYSTAYGLLLYSLGSGETAFASNPNDARVVKIFKRMKSWIYDFL